MTSSPGTAGNSTNTFVVHSQTQNTYTSNQSGTNKTKKYIHITPMKADPSY